MNPVTVLTPWRRWRLSPTQVVFFFLALSGFIMRVWLAMTTEGSNDVIIWRVFAEDIDRIGLQAMYSGGQSVSSDIFNHPPLMGYLAQYALYLAQALNLPFPFVFKLPVLVADVLTAVVLWDIWRRAYHEPAPILVVAAFGWSLVSILMTGYHGNTDSLGAFFCLLAVYLIERKQPFGGGLALAAALNIKLIPLLLVPALVLHYRSWRKLFRFGLGLGLGLLPFVPVLICCGRPFYQTAIAYNSAIDLWGLPLFLLESIPQPALAPYAQVLFDVYIPNGRYVVLGLILLCSLWARLKRWDAYEVAAMSLTLFLIFTPGFGVQYLIWVCPLLFAVGLGWGTLYSLLAGLFLGLVYYLAWDGGAPWRSLFSQFLPMPTPLFGLLVWVLLLQFAISRVLSRHSSPLEVSSKSG